MLVLMAALFARSVLAQSPTPTDNEVNRIAKQFYCPVCESTPLDVCPTEACRQWRELIREMLAEGKSEAEIRTYFIEHYGPQVLNEPPNKLVAYIIPMAAFLLGVVILWRGFQAWMKPSMTRSGVVPEMNGYVDKAQLSQDPYVAKLEEELRKRN
jgi:cytochrome c-type biogenesis protein CcmH